MCGFGSVGFGGMIAEGVGGKDVVGSGESVCCFGSLR